MNTATYLMLAREARHAEAAQLVERLTADDPGAELAYVLEAEGVAPDRRRRFLDYVHRLALEDAYRMIDRLYPDPAPEPIDYWNMARCPDCDGTGFCHNVEWGGDCPRGHDTGVVEKGDL